ncbi:hypothetical protein [Pseudoalteromonas maricaloris]|uniref:hypothetical protein n=1 Tax=Pseudoalteromonas maricaloris TaxID=184924 RepID=UPI003C238695
MRVLSISILLLLAGCQSTSHHKEPPVISGSNKVKLTIESPELLEEKSFFAFKNFTNSVEVDFYKGDKGCPFDGLHGNKDAYMFTVRIDRKTPVKTIDLPTGEEYTKLFATINDSNGQTTCPQNISFEVNESKSYALKIKGHPNPSSRCKASIESKDENGNTIQEPIKWSGPSNIFMGLYSYDEICKM